MARRSLQLALLAQETGFGFGRNREEANKLVSKAGAVGLGQILPSTFKGITKKYPDRFPENPDINDADQNELASQLVYDDNLEYYEGNEDLAITAYNAGYKSINAALDKLGKSKKDATFEDIKPYLTEEAQNYLPGVRKYEAKITGNPDEHLAGNESRNSKKVAGLDDFNLNNFKTKPERTGEGDLGTFKEFYRNETQDPETAGYDSNQTLQLLNKIYNSKKSWDPETIETIQDTVSDLAKGYGETDWSQILGYPQIPETGDVSAAIAEWEKSSIINLQEQGFNAELFKKAWQPYIEQVKDNEIQAYNNREKGNLYKGASAAVDTYRGIATGAVNTITGTASGALKATAATFDTEGLNGAIDFFDNIGTDVFGTPAYRNRYAVNARGYVDLDEEGKPTVIPFSSAGEAIGNLVAQYTIARYMPGGYGKLAVGTSNVAGGLSEAYDKAEQQGGSRVQKLLQMGASVPASLIDTVADLSILKGASPAIKELSIYNQRKLLTQSIGSIPAGMIKEGGTEALQTYAGTATEQYLYGTDTSARGELAESALSGALAGGGAVLSGNIGARRGIAQINQSIDARKQGAASVIAQGEQQASAAQAQQDAPKTQGTTPPGVQTETANIDAAKTNIQLPSVDRQKKFIKDFQAFQASTVKATYVDAKLSDLDPEMLDLFQFSAIAVSPEQVLLEKKTSDTSVKTVPEDLVSIDAGIEQTTRELREQPHHSQLEELTLERDIIQEELLRNKQYENPQERSNLIRSYKQAIKDLNKQKSSLESKRTREKKTENRVLFQREIDSINNQINEVSTLLKPFSQTHQDYVSDLEDRMQVLNNNIEAIMSPTYANDRSLKEGYLQDLMVKRDLLREDLYQQELEAAQAAASKEEGAQLAKPKEFKRGFRIKDGKNVKHIVPFNNKWFVTDSKNNPLSDGYNNFSDAVGFARTAEQVAEGTPAIKDFAPSATGVYREGEDVLFDTVPNIDLPAQADVLADVMTSSDVLLNTTPVNKQGVNYLKIRPDAVPNIPPSRRFTNRTDFARDGKEGILPTQILKNVNKVLKQAVKTGSPYQARISKLRTKGTGKLPKGALGYTNTKLKYIRVMDADSLQTLVHEFGHAIESDLNIDWAAQAPYVQDALKETAETWYPGYPRIKTTPDIVNKEGWAVFVEHYLDGNPVHHGLLNYYNTEFKTQYPESHALIEGLKKETHAFYNQAPRARTSAQRTATPPSKLKAVSEDLFENAKSKYIDDFAPYERISDKFYNLMSANKGSISSYADYVLTKGIPKGINSPTPIGKSIKDILKPISDKKAWGNFMTDMYDVHNLAKNDIASGIDLESLKLSLSGRPDSYDQHPEYSKFLQAQQEYYDWNKGMLDVMAQTSPTAASFVNALRAENQQRTGTDHGYYMPRETYRDEQGVLKALKGSATATIADPIKAIESSTQNLFAAAEKMAMRNALTDAYDNQLVSVNDMREVMGNQVPAYATKVVNLVEELRKRGIAVPPLHQINVAQLDELLTFFTPKIDIAKDAADGYTILPIISVDKQGEKTIRWFEVKNDLAQAIKPEFRKDGPAWEMAKNIGAFATNLVKMGAIGVNIPAQLVLTPASIVTAGYRTPDSGSMRTIGNYAVNYVKNILSTAQFWKDSDIKNFIELNGLESSHLGDNLLTEIYGNTPTYNSATKQFMYKATKGAVRVSNALEGLARGAALRTYIQSLGKPIDQMTPLETVTAINVYRRADTDFSRKGYDVRKADRFIPFLGAATAGMTQVLGDIKTAPLRTISTLGTLGIAAGFLSGYSHEDDDWYQDIEPSMRYKNFYMDFDGSIKRVRMPEIVSMFYGAGLAIHDLLKEHPSRKNTVAEALAGYIEAFSPVPGVSGALSGEPEKLLQLVPTGAKEFLELATGKDFFRGRDIVPTALQSKTAQNQYTNNTSELAKMIGQTVGASPMKIDHLINKVGLAGLLNKAVDATLNPAKEKDIGEYFFGSRRKTDMMSQGMKRLYDKERELIEMKAIEYKHPKQRGFRKQLSKVMDRLTVFRQLQGVAESKEQYEELGKLKYQTYQQGLDLLSGGKGNKLPNVPAGLKRRFKSITESTKEQQAEELAESLQ